MQPRRPGTGSSHGPVDPKSPIPIPIPIPPRPDLARRENSRGFWNPDLAAGGIVKSPPGDSRLAGIGRIHRDPYARASGISGSRGRGTLGSGQTRAVDNARWHSEVRPRWMA